MKLQSLQQLEDSIGGRPRSTGSAGPKVRLSIYVSQTESDQLKALARKEDLSVSQITRTIIRSAIAA